MQMMLFHANYCFDSHQKFGETLTFKNTKPTEEEIYLYVKYVVLSSKMEKEIPIMALIYIERMINKVGILINHWNWRWIVLITLIEGSKVWDDDTLENKHFPRVMGDVTLREINELEKVFLELLGFDLYIKGSEYAKYYFILRTL